MIDPTPHLPFALQHAAEGHRVVVACASAANRDVLYKKAVAILDERDHKEWGHWTCSDRYYQITLDGAGYVRFLVPGPQNKGLRPTHVLGVQLVSLDMWGRPFIPNDWMLGGTITPERNTVTTSLLNDGAKPLWEVQENEDRELIGSWLHECCKHCVDASHFPHTRGCPIEPAPQLAADKPAPTQSETLYAATQMLAQAGFTVNYEPPNAVSIVHGGDNPAVDSIVQALTSLYVGRQGVIVGLSCVMCFAENELAVSKPVVTIANGHAVCADHVNDVIEAG